MNMEFWNKCYEEILNEFNFSRKDDEESAEILSNILESYGFLSLNELIGKIKSSKKFIVFGAGPSLEKHIKIIKKYENLSDYILISADGATTALLNNNITPDIIVTDLDGKIDDLITANKNGSIMVIHAHGNNFNEIKKIVKEFKNVLGTTQSKPIKNLYNFGGFTDGDRSLFLAIALGAEQIILAGMDFGNIITKYSRPNLSNNIDFADNIKEKKLKYAEKLTNWAKNNENVEVIDLK